MTSRNSGQRSATSGPRVIQATPRQQVLLTVVTGLLLAASLVWAAASRSSTVCCFSAILLPFFGIFLASTLTVYANRRLLRVMQAPPAEATATATSDLAGEGLPTGAADMAPPPFATRIFDVDAAPDLSPAAAQRVERANRSFDRITRTWRQGVWFLLGINAALALLGTAVGAFCLPMCLGAVGLCVLVGVGLLRPVGAATARWSVWYYFGAAANTALFLATLAISLLALGSGLFFGIVTQPSITVTFGLAPVSVSDLALPAGWAIWGSRLLAALAVVLPALYLVWIRRRGRDLRRSVLADVPIVLLYLWVFDSPAVHGMAGNVLSPAWRFAGPVALLRGSYYLADVRWTPAVLTGRADRYVLETEAELAAALPSLKRTPNWLGTYPMNTLLCGDHVWQVALDALLAEADVALMNLCGFTRERRGCVYELGRLIDRLPTQRWLLLIDQTTDLDCLHETLATAWASMAPDSPNRDAVPAVQIFRLRSLEGQVEPESPAGAPNIAAISDLHVEAGRVFEMLCAEVFR